MKSMGTNVLETVTTRPQWEKMDPVIIIQEMPSEIST